MDWLQKLTEEQRLRLIDCISRKTISDEDLKRLELLSDNTDSKSVLLINQIIVKGYIK